MLEGRDQYGNRWSNLDHKRPKASLLDAMCARTAVRMFIDGPNGEPIHVGYVVSNGRGYEQSWVQLYTVEPWQG